MYLIRNRLNCVRKHEFIEIWRKIGQYDFDNLTGFCWYKWERYTAETIIENIEPF